MVILFDADSIIYLAQTTLNFAPNYADKSDYRHYNYLWIKEKLSFQISQRRDDKYELIEFLKVIAKNEHIMVGFNNLQFDYPLLHWFILNFQRFKK